MARAVKRQEKFLLCPGPGCWEMWSLASGGASRLMERTESISELPLSSTCIVALPTQHVYSLCVWLMGSDPAVLPDMVFAQLEKHGLMARIAEETIYRWDAVATEGSQTLVTMAVLPHALPTELLQTEVGSYDVSARCYPLPKNQMTIWHEGDRLVVAVTRESSLIYSNSLSDSTVTLAIVHELRCIQLELESQHATRVGGISVWGEFTADELQLLNRRLGLPVDPQARPNPRLPEKRWDMTPQSVLVEKAQIQERGRKRRVLYTIAAIYLLCLGGFASHVGLLAMKAWRIERSIAADRPRVQLIRDTSRHWDELEGAVNPAAYPIENLLLCSRVLPQDGVRFTLFEQQGKRIIIDGEAKKPELAYKLQTDLTESKDMKGYKWEMANPKLLANNAAKFHIEGSRPNASTN